ncbi:MAG: PaaI family thioesterase [Pseudomonadota bacterium]
MEPVMSVAEVNAYLAEVFPETAGRFSCTELKPCWARVDLHAGPGDLRPGGTVSGPTIFTLADCGFYMALLGMIGQQALAVTTNASIDFMRKPAPGAMWAEVSIHKLGRVLAVGTVLIYSEGVEGPVAQASMTYSVPPR